MSYPESAAVQLTEQVDAIASAGGRNVFLSDLQPDAHGVEYRMVTVDITKQDWKRICPQLLSHGWTRYGEQGLVHDLPDSNFLVLSPQF